MVEELFYKFTEDEMGQEKLNEANNKCEIDYNKLNLSIEQINYLEEKLFIMQEEYWKLGFKYGVNLIKECQK